MSLAALQEYNGENDGNDEEEAEEWDGSVPGDVPRWCKGLHRLITRALGDDCKSGGEPRWCLDNDYEFVEDEEERRELPPGSLQPFTRQPYLSDVPITEYTTCRSARVDGLLFGSGEKLGDWEAFTLFYVRPAHGKWRSLEVGQEVQVGECPFHEDAVVTRILRGTKAAGRADEAKTQHCYYVFLKVSGDFKYAALQHVTGDGATPTIALDWCDDTAFDGHPSKSNKLLANFQPKSASAVAKAAAMYVKKLAGGDEERPKKKQKRQAVSKRSDRACGKAVASESESDESDSEDGLGSDV